MKAAAGRAIQVRPPAGRSPRTRSPLAGNVYVSAIGQTSINNIKLRPGDLWDHAENDGKYPKDYPEFMEQIIRKNNIALPTLPYYLQEYAYDAPNHKLIILEYPDKKAAGDACLAVQWPAWAVRHRRVAGVRLRTPVRAGRGSPLGPLRGDRVRAQVVPGLTVVPTGTRPPPVGGPIDVSAAHRVHVDILDSVPRPAPGAPRGSGRSRPRAARRGARPGRSARG